MTTAAEEKEKKIRQKQEKEEERLYLISRYERELYDRGFSLICGIDEVGRGPLAGPVVAAAVILPVGCKIEGIDDSKKLSEAKRYRLAEVIKEQAIAWAVGSCNHIHIDQKNILESTRCAMKKAVESLIVRPEHLLIDAVHLEGIGIPQTAIIKGDSLSISIAAASIVAKCHRDRWMEKFALLYPGYGFEKNKGYGTALHLQQISLQGVCPIHRKSFLIKSLQSVSGGNK